MVLIQRDTRCDAGAALLELDGAIKECRAVHGVDPSVIIGPGCSSEVLQTRHLSEFYNIAMLSWGAGIPILSDKNEFPLFLRSTGPSSLSMSAYLAIFRRFGWRKTALLSADSYSQFHKALVAFFQSSGVEVTLNRVFTAGKPADGQADRLKRALMEVTESGTRVVILLGLAPEAREFAVAAHALGLKEGWAFLVQDLTENTWEGDAGWLGSGFQAEAREALTGSFGVVNGLEDTAKLRNFAAELAARVPAAERSKIDLTYSSYLYDAVQMWGRGRASAVRGLRARGLARKESALEVIEAIRLERFEGMAGPVEIENNDRVISFLVSNFNGTALRPTWMWSVTRGMTEVQPGSSGALVFPGPTRAVPSSQTPPDPRDEEALRVKERRRHTRNLVAKRVTWVVMLILWLAVWYLGSRVGFIRDTSPPKIRVRASSSFLASLPDAVRWATTVWELLQFLSFVIMAPREGRLLNTLGSVVDHFVAYGVPYLPRVYLSFAAGLFVISLSAPIAFFAYCSSSPARRASLKRFIPFFRRWLSVVTPMAPFYFPIAEVLFGTVINTLVRLFDCVPEPTTAANGTEFFLASALKEGGVAVKCWDEFHSLLCCFAALLLAPMYIFQVSAEASIQFTEPDVTILFSPAGLFAVKQAKVFIVCLVIGFHRGKIERTVTLALCAFVFLVLVWATRGGGGSEEAAATFWEPSDDRPQWGRIRQGGQGGGRAFCTDHRMARFKRSSFLLSSIACLAMLLNSARVLDGLTTLVLIGVGLALLLADLVASIWAPQEPNPAPVALLIKIMKRKPRERTSGPPAPPGTGTGRMTEDKEIQVSF